MKVSRESPEVLITKPLILKGDQLQLNVDASHGEVRVANRLGGATAGYGRRLSPAGLCPAPRRASAGLFL